jgi:predicted histidine transporter YuiF (NhaC family)
MKKMTDQKNDDLLSYVEKRTMEKNKKRKKQKIFSKISSPKYVYLITAIIGIVGTILSLVLLDESNMIILGCLYGLAIIVLYPGVYFVLKIDRGTLTKICAPLLLIVPMVLIVGYVFPDYEDLLTSLKFSPLFITWSVILLERELL